jgi:uncharacterized RDD family membrane protein YckC
MQPSDIDDLQKASNYRTLRKTLRAGSIGSIVFGAIAFLAGVTGAGESIMDVLLTLLGLFLLLEGLWIIITPTTVGLIVDGMALIAIGAWNISTTFYDISAEGSGHNIPGFVILGLWQIIWGLRRFGRYQHFASLPMVKPSYQVLKWMDDTVRKICKVGTAEVEDVIAFQVTVAKKQQSWRGMLSGDTAIFVEGRGDHVLFARKDDVSFLRQGEIGIGSLASASFQIGKQTWTGIISPEYLDKYEAWKRSEDSVETTDKKLAGSIEWQKLTGPEFQTSELPFEYAGFWRRFAAFCIDGLMLGIASAFLIIIPVLVMMLLSGSISDSKKSSSNEALTAGLLLYLVPIVIPWLYFTLMESSSNRATLGKMALGIIVIDLDGEKISFWKATGRYFAKFISALILLIGFLMAAITHRKQALHDIIAGSLVIDKHLNKTPI